MLGFLLGLLSLPLLIAFGPPLFIGFWLGRRLSLWSSRWTLVIVTVAALSLGLSGLIPPIAATLGWLTGMGFAWGQAAQKEADRRRRIEEAIRAQAQAREQARRQRLRDGTASKAERTGERIRTTPDRLMNRLFPVTAKEREQAEARRLAFEAAHPRYVRTAERAGQFAGSVISARRQAWQWWTAPQTKKQSPPDAPPGAPESSEN